MIPLTPDANVLASGLTHPDSHPAQLLREWGKGNIQFVVSTPLLDEVRAALEKPYFQQRRPREALLKELESLVSGSRVVPITHQVEGVASHAEDDRIIATAVSGGARFLVTGDHDLLRLGRYQDVTILSVRAFLATLPGLIEEQIQ